MRVKWFFGTCHRVQIILPASFTASQGFAVVSSKHEAYSLRFPASCRFSECVVQNLIPHVRAFHASLPSTTSIPFLNFFYLCDEYSLLRGFQSRVISYSFEVLQNFLNVHLPFHSFFVSDASFQTFAHVLQFVLFFLGCISSFFNGVSRFPHLWPRCLRSLLLLLIPSRVIQECSSPLSVDFRQSSSSSFFLSLRCGRCFGSRSPPSTSQPPLPPLPAASVGCRRPTVLDTCAHSELKTPRRSPSLPSASAAAFSLSAFSFTFFLFACASDSSVAAVFF